MSSRDGTSVDEKSFTIMLISSCVSSIVEAMRLILGVCRLYSGNGVLTCEKDREPSWIGISIVTSYRVNEGLPLLGLISDSTSF